MKLNFKILIVFMLFSFFSKANGSSLNPGDSLKGKYELNDPRNPNCPCHKYQKQAEDEYRKFLKEEKKKNAEKKGSLEKKDNTVKDSFSSRHKRKGIFFRKHRVGGKKHGREKKQRKSWLCTMF